MVYGLDCSTGPNKPGPVYFCTIRILFRKIKNDFDRGGGSVTVKSSNNSSEMQILVDLQIIKKSPTARCKKPNYLSFDFKVDVMSSY